MKDNGTIEKIYVVCGRTGRYDGEEVWHVFATFDKPKAEDRVKTLNAFLKEYNLEPFYTAKRNLTNDHLLPENPDDPQFKTMWKSCACEQVLYYIDEVEVV